MTVTELHVQLQADTATLAQIIDGLGRLEAGMEQARAGIFARRRGYFTPDEEDRVRQLLLAYRNYRLSAYEIINRYRTYEGAGYLPEQLRAFIVGYAAALTVYAKSQKLIQAYRNDPLVRQKLNEPEPAFGLEAGFFEMILARYTSLHNYATMVHAEQLWRRSSNRCVMWANRTTSSSTSPKASASSAPVSSTAAITAGGRSPFHSSNIWDDIR